MRRSTVSELQRMLNKCLLRQRATIMMEIKMELVMGELGMVWMHLQMPQSAGLTETNYDACEARKKKGTKHQQQIDEFQDKVLEVLKAPVEVATPVAPPPVEPKAYVDLAFAALIQKMKSNLTENEIMDTVEELQQVVHRVCREKRRRLEYQPNVSATPMFQQLQPIQGLITIIIVCVDAQQCQSVCEESK